MAFLAFLIPDFDMQIILFVKCYNVSLYKYVLSQIDNVCFALSFII